MRRRYLFWSSGCEPSRDGRSSVRRVTGAERGDVPSSADPSAVLRLREALWAAGYSSEGVRAAVDADGSGVTPRSVDLPLLLRRLPPDRPLHLLVRLFLLAVPVPRAAADAALSPLGLDDAIAMGLVRLDGDDAVARVRLAPYADLVLASDLVTDVVHDIDAGTVIGLSTSSRTLADVTVRRPVGDALDLGTGSGVQALLAARHAAHVVATDTNARALAFTAFNALLNGVGNVEVVAGDFVTAVQGRQFDLVVSNPPFVISPDDDYLFRDSGRPRDGLSREVVEGAAGLLREDGLAHVLVSWVHEPDDWSAPLREWVADLGCDAWLLHFRSYDPESYAVSWNQQLQDDPARYHVVVERWIEYFHRERIDAIGYGAVLLRRRSGETWVAAHSTGDAVPGPANDQVRELFGARDHLAALPKPEAILDERLVVDRRNRLDQTLRWGDGSFEVERATLLLERGLRFVAALDLYSAHLLSRFDGQHTVREAIDEAIELLGADGDRAAVEARTVAIVTQMVELGFVHPVTNA